MENKPLILDYAVNRTEKNSPQFTYNYRESMSYINMNGIPKAIIESNNTNSELLTKTRIYQEQDDDNIQFLEMLTKTKVHQERDDEDISLLELQTKTLVNTERDDESIDYN